MLQEGGKGGCLQGGGVLGGGAAELLVGAVLLGRQGGCAQMGARAGGHADSHTASRVGAAAWRAGAKSVEAAVACGFGGGDAVMVAAAFF